MFAYQRRAGYVGFGTVTRPATLVREFETPNGPLLKQPLAQPNLAHDEADAELAEYAVAVDWAKTFPINEAKTFTGVFANQNVVCKLRHTATIEFLAKEFGLPDHPSAS